ncbi:MULTISPECIES: DUF1109 domain-containing protein [Paraburkholderia]|uniref:DUF1109 domain-containing protein n=1 Tax=Paraburkholderia TaxID=1822464 RepID=UPI000B4029D1|nr:DUF1109 domain-containing protein [Paraburkholderia caledonica]
MRTEELVDLLSTGVHSVPPHAAHRRFATSIALGTSGSLLLMYLVFRPRPDLAIAVLTALFWMKLAFPLSIASGAMLTVNRLSRPGAKSNFSTIRILVGGPVLLVWLWGISVVAIAEPQDRSDLIYGASWRSCPLNILLLSLPTFIAVFLAVRSLAPTRLRVAGAFSGLLATSLATVVYCLHCPEMSPAFWSMWYVLGMALGAVVGALVGPTLLRW